MSGRDRPREEALAVLQGTEAGSFADALLDRARPSFDSRDNAFLLELVYGVLRNRERLDWVLNLFSAQPVARTDRATRNILRLGAYQLLFLDRVPASAAVNTSVQLAKKFGRKQGYVNGLLRNLDRRRSEISYPGPADPIRQSAVLHSHPAWLVSRWIERFGSAAEELLQNNNKPAPLVVRTNLLRTTREGLKAALDKEGVEAVETVCSPTGLALRSSPGFGKLRTFEQGWFLVQDEAAQLIGLLVSPRPGSSVLDACAAPGGKATHLAELMENRGTVTALESDPVRIGRIGENSRRLGITIIDPVAGDAAAFESGPFDAVLVDAPCSGLGVLRRHPDGRWNKDESQIRERAAVQRRILDHCGALVAPGGTLVYATCTTEPEENEGVVLGFLNSRAGAAFRVDDPRLFLPQPAARLVDDRGFFRTYPGEPAMDGFFGVRLTRTA